LWTGEISFHLISNIFVMIGLIPPFISHVLARLREITATSPVMTKDRYAFAEILLRRLAHGFPFAQRLSIARRDVRILGIVANVGEDLPRACAFSAFGQ